MSKKFVESLRALGTEQVTDRLAAYCQKRLRVLTDPDLGSLRTIFNVIAMLKTDHVMDLVRVAAEKNGVVLQGHDNTIAAIGRAAQERGSPAAAKILECSDAIDSFNKIGKERHAGFWERIRIGKEFRPSRPDPFARGTDG